MRVSRLSLPLLSLAALALSGCWGGFTQVPEADRTCPPRAVQEALQNQRLLAQMQDGATSWKDLRTAPAPLRKATLVKVGEPNMDLQLYRTGVPGCSWVRAAHLAEPVMLRNGIVIHHGVEAFDALTAQGWRIKEAAWPWQRYDFSYIPAR